jgi:hypothetical protein
MLASSSVFLNALDVAGPLTHQLLAGTQQVAHLLGRLVGHKARADQTVGHQIGQPSRVIAQGDNPS